MLTLNNSFFILPICEEAALHISEHGRVVGTVMPANKYHTDRTVTYGIMSCNVQLAHCITCRQIQTACLLDNSCEDYELTSVVK